MGTRIVNGARRRRRHVRLSQETVELLSDEPELLAIADAVQATQRPGRLEGSHPSLARRAALIAAVLGAVVLAVGIGLELSGRERDLIDRAAAAAGTGRVTTVVASRAFPGETVVDLESGSERPVVLRMHIWRDAQNGRTRFRVLHDHQAIYDAVTRRLPAQLLSTDETLGVVSDFASRYRQSLGNRSAVPVAGRSRVDGRTVVWLRLPRDEVDGDVRLDVALDAQTFAPVRLEPVRSAAGWTVTTFETANALGAIRATPRTKLLGIVSSSLVSSMNGTMASARRWLGAAFRSPGTGAGAGRLRRVQLQSIRLDRPGAERIVRGVGLSFGPVGSSLDINVASEPTQTHGFANGRLTISFSPIPQDGKIALARLGDRWVAQGRRDGSFFSIEGPSRSSVLTAARSLR
jgi:hypothetical protein